MSRPYQFSDPDDISSPLDRRPQQSYPAGQPPSFRQNVNRAKTKKWVEAKSYSYEGDDWGDYDEDDEYGLDNAPVPPTSGMRSVTGPVAAPTSSQVMRKAPSFDRGDERRAFSTGAPTTLRSPIDPTRQVSNTSLAPSHVSELSSVDPRHRANYSPTAEPPPLQARAAPTSASTKEKPLPIVPPTALAIEPIEMEDTSPIGPPIIRPADIYARMQAEREKELAGGAAPVGANPAVAAPAEGERLRPTVYDSSAQSTPMEEDEDELEAAGLTETALSNQDRPRTKRIDSTPPQLNIASFGGDSPWGGDDFWGSGNKSARGSISATGQPTPPVTSQVPLPTSRAPVATSNLQQASSLQHAPSNGMRTMVGRAFEAPVATDTGVHKKDSTRSNATVSTLSQGDTDGTSDISPIMSNVAPPAPVHDTTPVHVSERSHHNPVDSNRLSDSTLRGTDLALEAPPRAPFTSEERRRSLDTSPARSPARSPVVAQPSRLGASKTAEVTAASPIVPSPTDGAMREADLAAAAKIVPSAAAPAIAASEHEAQQVFLDRQPSLPSERSPRISRAESPTKGRVANLTNRFSTDGRRGSQESHRSSTSIDRGTAPGLSSSPTRTAAVMPAKLSVPGTGISTGRDGSLRPKMPGGWESFATTTTEASSERPFETQHESNLDDYEDEVVTPIAPAPVATTSAFRSAVPETPAFTPAATAVTPHTTGFFQRANNPDAGVDLTPTTDQHQLPAREVRRSSPPIDHSVGAMAALTTAGAGLAGAFGSDGGGDYQRKRYDQGDIMQRPYYNRFDSDITETTAADTTPSTPLASDNPLESRAITSNATSSSAPRINPLATTSAARGTPSSLGKSTVPSRHEDLEHTSVVAPAVAGLSAAALAHHERESHGPTTVVGSQLPASSTSSEVIPDANSSPTRSRAAPVITSLNSSRISHDEAHSPTFAKSVAPVAPMLASSHHASESPLDPSVAIAAASVAPVLAASHARANDEHSGSLASTPVLARNSTGNALVGPDHGRLSPTRPPVISKMSTDDDPTDFESDRLRKEIVRSLSPIDGPTTVHEPEPIGAHSDKLDTSAARPFSVIPKEYDYYFSDTDEVPEVPEVTATRRSVDAGPTTAATAVTGHHSVPTVSEPHQVSPLLPATAAIDPEDRAPSALDRKFSWEDESENHSIVSPISPPKEPHPVPVTSAPVSSNPVTSSLVPATTAVPAPTPVSATKAPPTIHTPVGETVDKAAPIISATTPATKSTLDTRSIADHPRLSGEGLHVVNAEPSDLHELPDTPLDQAHNHSGLAPVSPVVSEPRAASTGSATGLDATHELAAPGTLRDVSPAASRPAGSGTLPYEPKLPSFREIMTIKSPEQRISTMIDTRKQWSTHDTGLSGWLNRTFDSLPQHQHLRSANPQIAPVDPVSPRHRTTPSLGRVFSRTSMDGSPANYQRTSAGPSPAGQRSSGSAGIKGKELLSAAGVFGGKGVSGAKGLFAKAKAKARGSGGADRGDD